MTASPTQPITLHPANPHYFLFRGKPTVLITGTEHYGAVLNGEFDYLRYLDTLKADRLNLTRTFSGVYCEPIGAFNIKGNTLAPAAGKFISPFARSSEPGYANGGNRFDLTRWDEGYWKRAKEFIRQAGRRGIVVEYVLFCPFYEESMWKLSPMNAMNNVNGVGNVKREEVYTLKHADLQAAQERFVRKAVQELNEFDNLYFEICNEPYFGGVTLEWQRRIADVITEAERSLPNKHLIAQNIANDWAKVTNPHPAVSIFNFHYASPPRAVTENYGLNKPISFDETGFKGTADFTYRAQAWQFFLAGGAAFDHLDYSFTTAIPDGTNVVTDPTPGGGSPALRKELSILKEFLQKLDFVRMKPSGTNDGGYVSGGNVWVLSEPGRQYAAYLTKGAPADLALSVPSGRYQAEWVDTKTGEIVQRVRVSSEAERIKLVVPPYTEDIALRVARR